MSKPDDKLALNLNINPLTPDVIESGTIPVVVNESEQAEDDFQLARKNLVEASDIGNKALKEIADIASQSQSARNYEVLSLLLERVANINDTLVNIHEKKKQGKAGSVTNNTTNNNNLLISPKDLLNFMLEKENEKH